MDFLSSTFLGNTVETWLRAVGVTTATYVVLRLSTRWAARRITRYAKRTSHYWDDIIASAVAATKSVLILLVAAWVGSRGLELRPGWGEVLVRVAIIAFLVQAGLWASAALTTWLENRTRERREIDPAEVMTLNVIGIAARLALWSIVVLLALENVGVDVTALVAGLGIGGVAVALAAQNILGDLFASLSIALDKPFVLGDFVTVGDFQGNVEAIGLKTTRVRSISGEQVVFSNTDLLDSRIRNYGRLYRRRVVLSLGVTYRTPREQLGQIPDLLRAAIEERGGDDVTVDRSHLATYGDSAIVFEAVYHVLSPDYGLHMDIKQDVHLRIHELFDDRGIEFAYPTRTVYLEQAAGEAGSARG